MSKVLKRKKFDRYLSFQSRSRLLKTLLDKAIVVEIEQSIQACRDPKDDKFLELAVCGNATVIISGDKDLLDLNPFRGIQIITPQEFLSFSR